MGSQVLDRIQETENNFQSAIHRLFGGDVLGDAKIQEISNFLDENDKELVINILSLFSLEDFLSDRQVTWNVIFQKIEGMDNFKKNKIKMVFESIDILLRVKYEMLEKYGAKR